MHQMGVAFLFSYLIFGTHQLDTKFTIPNEEFNLQILFKTNLAVFALFGAESPSLKI